MRNKNTQTQSSALTDEDESSSLTAVPTLFESTSAEPEGVESVAAAARALTVSSIRLLISLEYTWRISMPSSSVEKDALATEKASSSINLAAAEASSFGMVP